MSCILKEILFFQMTLRKTTFNHLISIQVEYSNNI